MTENHRRTSGVRQETRQRLRAHIPAAITIPTTPATFVPFTAIDDNPSNWAVRGTPQWDFAVSEYGQYDLFLRTTWQSISNSKTVLLYRTNAGGQSDLLGGDIRSGVSLISITTLDETLSVGDKISVSVQVATAAQDLTSARLSIVKRSPPFV